MTFSNPAEMARGSSAAYTRALLDLLGDRDPLVVLRSLMAGLAGRLSALSDDAIARPEAEGKWSIRQVIEHLADSEMVYGYRMRLVVAEDEPALVGYDQDHFATRLHSELGDVGDTLEELSFMRRRNLRFVQALSDAELDRVGHHDERGPESVRLIVKLLAAHDIVHCRQIDRIAAAVAGNG